VADLFKPGIHPAGASVRLHDPRTSRERHGQVRHGRLNQLPLDIEGAAASTHPLVSAQQSRYMLGRVNLVDFHLHTTRAVL
jgi:hypothetical protein